MVLQEVPDPRHYGVVEGDYLEDGVLRIKRAEEKPAKPRSHHAIMPIYLFTDEIFSALSQISPGVGGELQLTDAIDHLASTGKRVIGISLKENERRLDIGSLETMLEALKVSLSHVEEGSNTGPEGREVLTANGPREMEPTRSSRTPSRKRSAVPLQVTRRTTRHRGG